MDKDYLRNAAIIAAKVEVKLETNRIEDMSWIRSTCLASFRAHSLNRSTCYSSHDMASSSLTYSH